MKQSKVNIKISRRVARHAASAAPRDVLVCCGVNQSIASSTDDVLEQL